MQKLLMDEAASTHHAWSISEQSSKRLQTIPRTLSILLMPRWCEDMPLSLSHFWNWNCPHMNVNRIWAIPWPFWFVSRQSVTICNHAVAFVRKINHHSQLQTVRDHFSMVHAIPEQYSNGLRTVQDRWFIHESSGTEIKLYFDLQVLEDDSIISLAGRRWV